MGSFPLDVRFLQIFSRVGRESVVETVHFFSDLFYIYIYTFFFDEDFLTRGLGKVFVFCAA